jgi:hypothetical protein
MLIHKPYKNCLRCGKEITPGLMNEAKHWLDCPKNPNRMKHLQNKTPLIEEIIKKIELWKKQNNHKI